MADTVRCITCQATWQPDDIDRPDPCPSCGEPGSVVERCVGCPVTQVEAHRAESTAGHLLDRVLEHEFDAKHYRMEAGDTPMNIREGLKILEQERAQWEKETHERKQQEYAEKQRIREMQARQQRMGGF